MCVDYLKSISANSGYMDQQCLIVEQAIVAEFRDYLKRLPFFSLPEVCNSLAEAQGLLQKKSYELICLEVDLLSQAELDLIRSFPRHIPLVIASSRPEMALEGFDLGAADFLLKPFTFLRFTRAVNRALSTQVTSDLLVDHPFLFLKKGHSFQRFNYGDIDYIQAYGIYCKIYGKQKVDVVNETISNLEQALPSQQFLRVHKSYIVNLAKITEYSYRTIAIGSHQISLGAAYRERFEGFLRLLGKKGEDTGGE
ncbi:LytR/AlgR family response regulator transcription factor [Larkinella sp. VNQ87]|uniref:LytR/AlgR family response regulator transcription factor n=1 Tax=Larkinella sp. VNQ87 TaxID=3400921 RepID=UPI003C0F7056